MGCTERRLRELRNALSTNGGKGVLVAESRSGGVELGSVLTAPFWTHSRIASLTRQEDLSSKVSVGLWRLAGLACS